MGRGGGLASLWEQAAPGGPEEAVGLRELEVETRQTQPPR